MRQKFKMHFDSPIQNLNEKSFLYKRIILQKKKLPILNHEKSISYSKPFHIYTPLDKNYSLAKSQNDIKQGIVWYKNDYFKVPKLILPQQIKMIKSPLSERNLHLSKSHKKLKINNDTFNLTKGDLPIFQKFEQKRDLNEVLGLKKEGSELNIYFNKKREIDFDKYIQKLGVLKFLDERILKLVRVGKVQTRTHFSYKKLKGDNPKVKSPKKVIFSRYLNKKFFEQKIKIKNYVNKSYDNLLSKKKFGKKKKDTEAREEKIETIRNRRVSLVQKEIDKYDEVFKDINWKIQNFYEKKRKEFEKIVEDEFPIQINNMKT
jgi:hypothetical protein